MQTTLIKPEINKDTNISDSIKRIQERCKILAAEAKKNPPIKMEKDPKELLDLFLTPLI